MTVDVLMVGAGGVARRHVEVLTGLGARVVGVVDPVQAAAEQLAQACGATAYASLETALDASRPDAAYVCVPPFAHGPPEKALVAHGLPFFVEKPVAVDLATAEEVAALVADAGLVTATGYHWRCLDVVDRARELLAEAPAVLASGYWLDKRPPVPWWADTARSGGQVVEQLTHVLDLARVLLGEAVEVYAAGTRVSAGPAAEEDAGDVDDATAATVRFGSGAVATLAATSVLELKHRAALHTFSRGMVLELSEGGLVVDRAGERSDVTPAQDPRVTVDREFLDAVEGRREATRAPYGEALRSHRLGCALAESARSGSAVVLDVPGSRS